MNRLSILCGVLLGAALMAPGQQSRTLQVQLHYTGSGTVDEGHKIFVALWDSADFNGGPPAEVKSATSKNGIVTFSDVKTVPAYVSAAYDPSGSWDGASGPPPIGASLGMYSKAPPKPDPIDIAPGKASALTMRLRCGSPAPALMRRPATLVIGARECKGWPGAFPLREFESQLPECGSSTRLRRESPGAGAAGRK
jgi:hypothetical protein